MTAEQRAELLKHVMKNNLSDKISYRDFEKIAKDLNLTMEQVSLFEVVGLGFVDYYPFWKGKCNHLQPPCSIKN